MISRPGKAVLFFVMILGTYVTGMALSGFDNVYYAGGRYTLLTQLPGGMAALVGMWLRNPDISSASEEMPLFKIGTVYTAVAGLLNILVIMDAVYSAYVRGKGKVR